MNQQDYNLLIDTKRNVLAHLKELFVTRHIHGTYVEIPFCDSFAKAMYYPGPDASAPVYFDIHGGGFVWGAMEEGDLFCHHLNEQMGYAVYSLDYPLGPDVRFPESLYYLYDLIYTMYQNEEAYPFDRNRMVVGGRSAGGNLAAALCLLAKERKQFQFACQILDHPYLDLCHIIDDAERYIENPMLPAMMEKLAEAYADGEDRKNILCSPLNADLETLKDLPPAVIQTCELDMLRNDGDLYAKKLREAGVTTIWHCFPEVAHGFTEIEGPMELAGQEWLMESLKEICSIPI